jgi:hypothetical protein
MSHSALSECELTVRATGADIVILPRSPASGWLTLLISRYVARSKTTICVDGCCTAVKDQQRFFFVAGWPVHPFLLNHTFSADHQLLRGHHNISIEERGQSKTSTLVYTVTDVDLLVSSLYLLLFTPPPALFVCVLRNPLSFRHA